MMDFNIVDIGTFHCYKDEYTRSPCGFTGMHHAPSAAALTSLVHLPPS